MSEQPVTVDHPPEESMSFMDKAAGIFYEPSRVFESVKKSGVKFADWFVPVLVLSILASVSVYVRFSTPDLRYQSMQVAVQAINKMESEGKLTSEQAQQARQRMESGSGTFEGFGIIGALIGTFIFFFILAGIWLLVGKFALKGAMNYSHAMGIAGLSSWIAAVGVIIGIAMSVTMSRLNAGLNLGMFATMNIQSKGYILLSRIDLFALWGLFVVAVGLAVLAGKKLVQSVIWVYGIWIVWTLVSTFLLGGRFG